MNIFKRKSVDVRGRNRQPQGIPTGGRFAAEQKAAPDFGLPAADEHFDFLGSILHGDHEGGTEQVVAEARGLYGDETKGLNTVMALELMGQVRGHTWKAQVLDKQGNETLLDAHEKVLEAIGDLASQVRHAQSTDEAVEDIKAARHQLAMVREPEDRYAARTLRHADYQLAYVQHYIEWDERVRSGAPDSRDFDGESDRWAAALADQQRGLPVTVGNRTDLTPEQARTVVASNALADYRLDLLQQCDIGWNQAVHQGDYVDAIGELPEAIDAAATQDERIAAVQAARERMQAIMARRGADSGGTAAAAEVFDRLAEADRLLGRTFNWETAGI